MKERLVNVLAGLALLAIAAWLVSATEWVDVDTPTPAHGEAVTNPLYATEKLLRVLGAVVSKQKNLDVMPPAQARLVLVSRDWDLFPERAQRLREWVRQGGHLVIPGSLVSQKSLKEWLPVVEERPLKQEGVTNPPKPVVDRNVKDKDCTTLTEPDLVLASYNDSRAYRICGSYFSYQYLPTNRQLAPLWSLQSERGIQAVRVQYDKGTVTVMGPWTLLYNSDLLRADNAALMVTALQARAGAEFWFVAEEAREPFVPWLWHQAWATILLGLLALAVALWRASIRFGPLVLPATTQRRSMAEQVRGTARFLHMHGPKALHAAQLRALHESARRQLRGFSQRDTARRTTDIAHATGLAADLLARAQADRQRNPGVLVADLELLETARRRLDAAQAALRTHTMSESSDTSPTSSA